MRIRCRNARQSMIRLEDARPPIGVPRGCRSAPQCCWSQPSREQQLYEFSPAFFPLTPKLFELTEPKHYRSRLATTPPYPLLKRQSLTSAPAKKGERLLSACMAAAVTTGPDWPTQHRESLERAYMAHRKARRQVPPCASRRPRLTTHWGMPSPPHFDCQNSCAEALGVAFLKSIIKLSIF